MNNAEAELSYQMTLSPISIDILLFFFFNDTAPTEIYPLSLPDALPILSLASARYDPRAQDARPHRRGALPGGERGSAGAPLPRDAAPPSPGRGGQRARRDPGRAQGALGSARDRRPDPRHLGADRPPAQGSARRALPRAEPAPRPGPVAGLVRGQDLRSVRRGSGVIRSVPPQSA